MNRRLRVRFRFSLLTLLIAMAWSGVVVWVNTTPHYPLSRVLFPRVLTQYGWPWVCLRTIRELHWPGDDSPFVLGQPLDRSWLGEPLDRSWYHSAFAGDIAVGVLLVLVLTWGSNQLPRRVGARLRRRSETKLGEQQALTSQSV